MTASRPLTTTCPGETDVQTAGGTKFVVDYIQSEAGVFGRPGQNDICSGRNYCELSGQRGTECRGSARTDADVPERRGERASEKERKPNQNPGIQRALTLSPVGGKFASV